MANLVRNVPPTKNYPYPINRIRSFARTIRHLALNDHDYHRTAKRTKWALHENAVFDLRVVENCNRTRALRGILKDLHNLRGAIRTLNHIGNSPTLWEVYAQLIKEYPEMRAALRLLISINGDGVQI